MNIEQAISNSVSLNNHGFSNVQYMDNGQALFNNGHVAISKDLIFGLSVYTENGFVPLSEGDEEQVEHVAGLIRKGTLAFPWWKEFLESTKDIKE